VVLSRTLASESHWPPIDVLESLSRLQPHLVAPEVAAAVAKARKHLSEYRRHADLISIGAYRAGSDPAVDAAIAAREPLKALLTQDAGEIATLHESQSALVSLMNRAAAPAAATPAGAPSPTARPATSPNRTAGG
jgi:flagellum-specific ATP synthase